MAFYLILTVLLVGAVLGPIFGADSRDLARRGNRYQYPAGPGEGFPAAR